MNYFQHKKARIPITKEQKKIVELADIMGLRIEEIGICRAMKILCKNIDRKYSFLYSMWYDSIRLGTNTAKKMIFLQRKIEEQKEKKKDINQKRLRYLKEWTKRWRYD